MATLDSARSNGRLLLFFFLASEFYHIMPNALAPLGGERNTQITHENLYKTIIKCELLSSLQTAFLIAECPHFVPNPAIRMSRMSSYSKSTIIQIKTKSKVT